MVQKKLPTINSAHGSETRNIINELIKLFNGMGYTYDEALRKAQNVLNEAQKTNNMNKDVQRQLNDIILENGDSEAEVVQARGGYDLLKNRLDENVTQSEVKSNLPTPKSLTLSANGDNRRPFITFVDDDGFSQYYDYIAPTLEAKGFVGCPAIITSTTGTSGRMSKEQLRELQGRGHEILSHTQDHLRFSTLTLDQIEYQCKTSKETLIGWDLNVETIIYPGGDTGGALGMERIKKYYRSGWRSSSSLGNEQHRVFKDSFTPYRVDIDWNTLSHLKEQVDICKAEGNWLVFTTHANIQDATRKQRFADIVEYIASQNVEVGTIKQGLDIFGNTIDVGSDSKKYFKILADGDAYSNAVGSVFKSRLEGYDIDENTPPGYFEEEKITYSHFRNEDKSAVNFPESHMGILETFVSRVSPSDGYQIWKPRNSISVYKRGQLGTIIEGHWGEWTTSGIHTSIRPLSNAPSNDIKENITLSTTNAADGFPGTGTLLTLKIESSSNYIKQLYFPINTNELYYRTYKQDGTITNFEKAVKKKSKEILFENIVFAIGEKTKMVSADISDLVGNAVASAKTSYTLNTNSSQVENIFYNHRISGGELKIWFFNPNSESSKTIWAPTFKIDVFE